jgi:hypothetical protein
MLKFSHTIMIVLSGLVWFVVGVGLLSLGINILIALAIHDQAAMVTSQPLLQFLSTLSGTKEAAVMVLLAFCLFVGYMKGRYVLGKSAIRGINRILAFPKPMHLKNIYSPKYYILLASMMFLGFLAKLLPSDIRGTVDVIIGAALINGAIIYFRAAYELFEGTKKIKET